MKRKMLGMAGVAALLFSVSFASAAEMNLIDVTKSETIRGIEFDSQVSGSAYSYYSEANGFAIKAKFSNLPDAKGDDFYEGWAVRKSPFAFISTGKVTKGEDGKYYNMFHSKTDYRGYDFYVLTLEPNDGDTSPADHIIEGDMKLLTSQEYADLMSNSMMKKDEVMHGEKKMMMKEKMMKGKYYSRVKAIFAKYDEKQLMTIVEKITDIRAFYEAKTDISETKKTKIFEILDTVDYVLEEKLDMMSDKIMMEEK